MATPVKFQAKVSKISRHCDDVVTYEFSVLGRRPRYRAGQFLHLALDPYDPSSHWPDSRVFTIASGATNKELIRLSISAKGIFTRRIIDTLEVGSEVWMKAPYGEFIIRQESDKQIALIAGGTGVAPFVAFMEDAIVKGIESSVSLHYGARCPDLLTFKPLAEQCSNTFDGFDSQYYVEIGEHEGMIKGRINLEHICSSLDNVLSSVFYLCGPVEMVSYLSSSLKEMYGVSSENILIDDWGDI